MCVRSCPVVSGRVRSCPVMSGRVRLCPVEDWTFWTCHHMILSKTCPVCPERCPIMSGPLSGPCPISCPIMSEKLSGMSGNVRKHVRNVQSWLRYISIHSTTTIAWSELLLMNGDENFGATQTPLFGHGGHPHANGGTQEPPPRHTRRTDAVLAFTEQAYEQFAEQLRCARWFAERQEGGRLAQARRRRGEG